MILQPTRREFLRTLGATGLAAATSNRSFANVAKPETLRVLGIGVVGSIGGTSLAKISSHPRAEIVGLCDVDQTSLDQAAAQYPKAFTCRDYRQAFSEFADRFDAVVVSTPDHTHAPIMLGAMALDKHVYGEKPLVQQLEELSMMDRALTAKPGLITQLGNQRMASMGRRAAVEVLRRGMLGKAIEAHAWVESPNNRDYFHIDQTLDPACPPPPHLDWNLWQGPCEPIEYHPRITPRSWRSFWDYGTSGLGDWGCHVLDVVFFAYPQLQSPVSVQTFCRPSPDPLFHAFPCQSTITYGVSGDAFLRPFFPIHYSDSAQAVSRASIGLPAGKYPDSNMTVVVCEGGTLSLTPDGRLEIWRDGKVSPGLKMPGLPDFPRLDHHHAWVDNCLGGNTELRTPFAEALRMTEACLLAVKASRFPGEELRWDRKALRFPNHDRASGEIVRRNYREGFAPPSFT